MEGDKRARLAKQSGGRMFEPWGHLSAMPLRGFDTLTWSWLAVSRLSHGKGYLCKRIPTPSRLRPGVPSRAHERMDTLVLEAVKRQEARFDKVGSERNKQFASFKFAPFALA